MTKPVIGIIGAGKLGMTLAKLGLDAGYQVNIAGSREPESIQLSVSVLANGAKPMYDRDVFQNSEIIILALPLSKYDKINKQSLANKIVIDAMNYWWETDSPSKQYFNERRTSSEYVQEYFDKSYVVKAFNHMGYHDLAAMPGQERVIAYAGHEQEALQAVAELITGFGFIPYFLGDLHQTRALEPEGVLFGVNANLSGVKHLLHVK